MLHLKKHAPNIKGIGCWAYGSLVTALGFIVYAFFPYPASFLVDFTYSLVLNILIFAGDALFLSGFFIFRENQ